MEVARGENIRKRKFFDMDIPLNKGIKPISYKNIGINTLPKNNMSRKILFKDKISRDSISKDSLAKDNLSKSSMLKDDLTRDNSPKNGLIGKKRSAPLDISFQNMNSSMPSSTQKRTKILDEEIEDQSTSNENSPVIVDLTLKPSYMPKISRITEIIHKMKELNMNRIEDALPSNKKRNEYDDAKNILLQTMEMDEEDYEAENVVIEDSPYLNASLSEDDTDSSIVEVETDYSEEEKESMSESESSSDDESYSLYDSF
uniref:Uncharacterized protein DP238L n=1 Tax=African swine fever virus (isolate Pig/Kenya/KEN-50/1950) TaxID=561445 RepID=VFD38_ASFK5|nr:RecName: Full=Uncharacterized protein DP238L [African swine fever virus pig/Kenya/KEN-50/1950]